ncbi:MAG: thioesterase family protein [Candidatus Latescibacterota bacterium]
MSNRIPNDPAENAQALVRVYNIRVRYADTDPMGVVYYSRYLEWFEAGRTEYLRQAGWPYRRMEEEGVFLPVVEAHVQYHRSARYDDLVQIRTSFCALSGARLKILCEVWRDDERLACGYTVHAFLNRAGKPIRPPGFFVETLRQHE